VKSLPTFLAVAFALSSGVAHRSRYDILLKLQYPTRLAYRSVVSTGLTRQGSIDSAEVLGEGLARSLGILPRFKFEMA